LCVYIVDDAFATVSIKESYYYYSCYYYLRRAAPMTGSAVNNAVVTFPMPTVSCVRVWLRLERLDVVVGIFVALTLTAVAALLVFWHKSNSVFALQKCEQRDIDDQVLHRRAQRCCHWC